MSCISTLVARGKQAWTRSIAPRRARPTFVRSNRIVLASLFALTVVCVMSAQANAANLPVNTTEILSGTPSLLAPLPAPVSNSLGGRQSADQTGRLVAFASASDGLSTDDNDGVVNVYLKDRLTAGGGRRASAAASAPTPKRLSFRVEPHLRPPREI